MKLFSLLGAILLTTSGLVRADFVLVQNTEGGGQKRQITIKIGGDHVRTDMEGVSSLMDMKTGDITTMVHAQKSYMVMNQQAAAAMAGRMAQMLKQKASGSAAAAPTATGSTAVINGFKAAEYTYNTGSVQGTVWISTDVPNADQVHDALVRVRNGSINDATKAFSPDFSAIKGVPVRTEVNLGVVKISTDLVSVKEQAVPAADYQVPTDYKKIDLPSMGAGAGGAPGQ